MISRAVFFVAGAALIALSAFAFSVSMPPPIGIASLVAGVLMALGAVFEKSVYKKIEDHLPPGSWQDTGERFIDPKTKRAVAVYADPKTGKRVYIAMDRPPQ